MAWERILPCRGLRMGDLAKVRMSIESKEAGQQKASLTARMFIAADIARQLGWRSKDRVVIDRDPEWRRWRVSKAGRGDADQSFALMGPGKKAASKTPEVTTVGMRISLATLGVLGPRVRVLPETVDHTILDGALILTPPAWAWDDYVLPPNQPVVPKHAKALPKPAIPLTPTPAPTAAPAQVTMPSLVVPPNQRPKSLVKPDPMPTDSDYLEAEDMLRAGKTGREVAEWFGWTPDWGAQYATAFRRLTSGDRRAA